MRKFDTTLLGLALVIAVSTGCSQSSSNPTEPTPTGDTVAPMVIAVTPADGAIEATAITATFSEPLLVATVSPSTFSLTDAEGTIVPGFVQYQGDAHKAIFTPSINLTPGRTYTARISAGVEDVAGNAMVSEKVWSFTIPVPHNPETPRSD